MRGESSPFLYPLVPLLFSVDRLICCFYNNTTVSPERTFFPRPFRLDVIGPSRETAGETSLSCFLRVSSFLESSPPQAGFARGSHPAFEIQRAPFPLSADVHPLPRVVKPPHTKRSHNVPPPLPLSRRPSPGDRLFFSERLIADCPCVEESEPQDLSSAQRHSTFAAASPASLSRP